MYCHIYLGGDGQISAIREGAQQQPLLNNRPNSQDMKPRPEASLLTATRKQQTELTQSETPPTIIIDSITVLSCKRTRSINHFTPRSLLSKAELQSERYIVMRCYTKKTRSLVEMNENVF